MKRLTFGLPKWTQASWIRWAALSAGVAIAVIGVNLWTQTTLYQEMAEIAVLISTHYHRWFSHQTVTNPLVLMGLSFLGGLVSSISPCILSMLPVNLAYIGTQTITSRRSALLKAGAFVLGVATVLSLLGLISSLASVVLIQYQGWFHVAIALIMIGMALSLLGWIRLPLPTLAPQQLPLGPYGVGCTFALVSSPCSSPVLISVLAASAASGSQITGALAMFSYALGYTAIIFLASLFTSLVKQTRSLLTQGDRITQVASLFLLIIGGFYGVSGIRWIFASVLSAYLRAPLA